MDEPRRRRRFYLSPEVQFPLIALLIVLISLEGGLIGWGIYRAVEISQNWFNPHLILDFSLLFLGTAAPIVLVNFAAGVYFSQKIAGPLEKIARAMGEIAEGRVDQEVVLRNGDLLESFAEAFNEMTEALKVRQGRENKDLSAARGKLRELKAKIESLSALGETDREALEQLVRQAEAKLAAALSDETADLGEAAHLL